MIKCKRVTVSITYHGDDGSKHHAYYDLRQTYLGLFIRRDRVVKDITTITRFVGEIRKSLVKFLS